MTTDDYNCAAEEDTVGCLSRVRRGTSQCWSKVCGIMNLVVDAWVILQAARSAISWVSSQNYALQSSCSVIQRFYRTPCHKQDRGSFRTCLASCRGNWTHSPSPFGPLYRHQRLIVSSKDGSTNPRGIPYAPFVDKVEDYVSSRGEVDGTMKSFQEMISYDWIICGYYGQG